MRENLAEKSGICIMEVDEARVAEILPHAQPFLFIDKATVRVDGTNKTGSITATWYVDPQHPVFIGHFPQKPIMPGVLLIEAAAQACAILGSLINPEIEGLCYLDGTNGVKFTHMVKPGSVITIEADYMGSKDFPNRRFTKTEHYFHASIKRGEKICAIIEELIGATTKANIAK
jgi:3-hydroxyacyl-[acyl-carrier-protein] dehydratase